MDKVELDNVGDLITRNRLMEEAKISSFANIWGSTIGKRILKYQTKIWPRNGRKTYLIEVKH